MNIPDLENNQINDTFPFWLENLEELQVLILKSNRLFGPVTTSNTELSFSKLQIFDLSSNDFYGFLPLSLLKNFKAMMSLNPSMSKATYMSTITRTFYGIDQSMGFYEGSVSILIKRLELELTKIITSLKTIDLSSNNFSAEIPEVIGNLKFLKCLNLSHNKFSDRIPSTLENLSMLESLDFSWNKL